VRSIPMKTHVLFVGASLLANLQYPALPDHHNNKNLMETAV